MCPPLSPCKGASIGSRRASCAMHKHFCGWKRLLCGWGTCSLRMETPLRGRSGGHTGAAPTISRMARVIRLPASYSPLHKHEVIVAARGSPLHKHEFIVAANSLPLHKHECIVVARCSPLHKHDGIVVARGSPPIIRAVYRRKTARRRYSALFIAGKQFAADIPRCLSQENSSPPIFRAVYRRKTVRR